MSLIENGVSPEGLAVCNCFFSLAHRHMLMTEAQSVIRELRKEGDRVRDQIEA